MLDKFVSYLFGGLFAAFVLSLFYFDKMLLEVAQPFFTSVKLTDSHYYVLFALLGVLLALIEYVVRNKK